MYAVYVSPPAVVMMLVLAQLSLQEQFPAQLLLLLLLFLLPPICERDPKRRNVVQWSVTTKRMPLSPQTTASGILQAADISMESSQQQSPLHNRPVFMLIPTSLGS
jgi:hypothetical protein